MSEAEQIQNDIDTILMFMNDDLESSGSVVKHAIFGFLPGENDYEAFQNIYSWTPSRLEKILKICLTRALVEESNYNDHREALGAIALTEEGQSRAISVKHGKDRSYELGSGMQIASLTVHGPAQVGNGNVQNFQNFFNQLTQQIEAADATEAEKQEARSLLAKFLEHPLVCSIVGGITGSLG
jgi:hypothetical protein